jgi:hypothetical protein
VKSMLCPHTLHWYALNLLEYDMVEHYLDLNPDMRNSMAYRKDPASVVCLF